MPGAVLRHPCLHAQPFVVDDAHPDERLGLPTVCRVEADGVGEAVDDAVRRAPVEDERVARLDAHRLVADVEVDSEPEREQNDAAACEPFSSLTACELASSYADSSSASSEPSAAPVRSTTSSSSSYSALRVGNSGTSSGKRARISERSSASTRSSSAPESVVSASSDLPAASASVFHFNKHSGRARTLSLGELSLPPCPCLPSPQQPWASSYSWRWRCSWGHQLHFRA